MYYSQYKQDQFIAEKYFPGVTDGFFIEIGADDGVDKSNTYHFEQKGWRGICIEPSPSRFSALLTNRKCECLNTAISSREQEFEFLDITGYGKGLSGIVQNYDPKHVERIERETEGNPKTLSKNKVIVKAIRFDKILKERDIKHVDYCSIDVEGSELDILRSIDFSTVHFNVFTIEDQYDNAEVHKLMLENSFQRVAKIGPDVVFVNKNIRRV